MNGIATSLRIEPAQSADASVIVDLIRELADYERLLDKVQIGPADIQRDLFGSRPYAEAALARVDQQVVGFALWFYNYSTFAGRPGLYLEDLYVRPAWRGHGHGAALLKHLAGVALERGCARFEWSVLDWNESAIRFYRQLGAVPMADWTVYRVTGAALFALAGAS